MPYIIVKLATGKPEQQTVQLAETIVQDVLRVLNCGGDQVSLAIQEIEPQEWSEKVYKPEILNGPESSTKSRTTQSEGNKK